jgi:hypothetical protein
VDGAAGRHARAGDGHPSFVLRQRDSDSRQREYAAFLDDLAGLKRTRSRR